MQMIIDFLHSFGNLLLQHKNEVALAVVATALIIFGEDINAMVRRTLRPYNFVIRFSGFVILCAFGYGFLTVYSTRYFVYLLQKVDLVYVPFIVVVAFLILALFASRRRQI